MKILLIGFTKLSYMPYMNFYLEELLKDKNEVHLLYWNRDGKCDIEIHNAVILHEFNKYQEDEVNKVLKIGSFLGYRNKALSLLKNGDYDLLIVMHTIPAVLLFDILSGLYRDRFILDYRDVTLERYKLFKMLIHILVKKSLLTFVSSDAFRDFLPRLSNIHTSHNLLMDSINYRNVRRLKPRDNSPIRIRFWGFIRHEEINKKIIKRFANDPRFIIHYHGREQETAKNLKKFCKKIDTNNVYFHGEYKPTDRYCIARETDLIHNFYENDNKTNMAMGNKYYDGVIFYIPQLCNVNSQMGKMVTESDLGYVCEIDDESFSEKIFRYYNSINWDQFEKNCDKELDRIIKEYNQGKYSISQVTRNG
jgi:hypothetical protein